MPDIEIEIEDLIEFCNKEIKDSVNRDIMHQELLTFLFDVKDRISCLESENKTLRNKLSQLTDGKY